MDLLFIFFFLGGISLLRLVYEDVKSLEVDERVSNYMFGVVGCIFLFLDQILVWLILMLVFTIVLSVFKQKYASKYENFVGSGDITVLSWIIPTLLVFNWVYGVAFGLIWLSTQLFMFTFAKNQKVLPGLVAITIGFLLTWFMQAYAWL